MDEQSRSVSVNEAASPIVAALLNDAASLRLRVHRGECTLIDAGIDCVGGLEAGRRIAELSMAGLGRVSLVASPATPSTPWHVVTHAREPMLACIASQMAGWLLSDDEKRFKAIGSGPARALAAKEKEFEAVGYEDHANRGCLVLETDRFPPAEVVQNVAEDCGIEARALTLVLCPTQSLAGSVQIAARIISTTLLKMQSVGLDVESVVDAIGSAPLPPPGGNARLAMGRTNDALLYGGEVQVYVRSETLARDIAERVPSRSSSSYGKPFQQVFEEAGGFYNIDTALFAPARVAATALESGRTFVGGQINREMLERSFGVGGAGGD